MGLFKLLNELMAVDVVGRESVLGSHQTKGGSQVGFAYTRRAEKDHMFSVLQKARRRLILSMIYSRLGGLSPSFFNLSKGISLVVA